MSTYLSNFSGIPAQAADRRGGWKAGVASGAGMGNIYSAPTITDLGTIDKLIIERHPFLPYWDGKELSEKPGPYQVTDDLNHIRTISIISQLPFD